MSTATATGSTRTRSSSPVMTHRQILLVIFGLMAGMFLSALDQTVVGTAIRTIGDDLNGLSQQAWVTTGYLIVSTIATPIYGKLSDLFGRRPLFIIAIVVFIIGSILSTFSQSMLELAAFRAVQGLGAGGLMSMPLAIMGDILAPRERAKYQGYFLAVFGISSVIGPLVGGLFAGAHEILFISGWRWVFLINVPIGIAALVMVLAFLHIPHHAPARVRIDWWGAGFVIMALVPLLLVAEQGREWGWTSAISIACYAIGVVGIIAFVIAETLMKDDALIPLKLFRSGTFSMATIIGVFVGFGMFGAMLTIPLYLQLVFGATPTESGFLMLPMIGGLMVASIVSGQLIARTGRYRVFPILGTAFLAAGFFTLTRLQYDSPYGLLAIGMVLIGLGLGQLMQTLTIASQNSVGIRDMGVATSASTFFRQIGGTLGTAVLLSLLFSVMPVHIQTNFTDKATLSSALDAALDPQVGKAPVNAGIMNKVYDPILDKITSAATQQAQQGVDEAKSAAAAAVADAVAAGKIPAAAQEQATAQAQSQAIEKASSAISEKLPVATIASDGTVSLDFSNATARQTFVDQIADEMSHASTSGSGSGSFDNSTMNDTSFLVGADPRLTKPLVSAFNQSAVQVYWVGLGVVLSAFVLTLFFRTPPLRQKSALQEAADAARPATGPVPAAEAERGTDAAAIATATGSLVVPDASTTASDQASEAGDADAARVAADTGTLDHPVSRKDYRESHGES